MEAATPPIKFSEKVKNKASGTGYPTQISASDLDENFLYATLDVPEKSSGDVAQPFKVSETSGSGGKKQRQLFFEPEGIKRSVFIFNDEGVFEWLTAPEDGTHVLGIKDGAFEWIETEEC